jgi:hypothetical protein
VLPRIETEDTMPISRTVTGKQFIYSGSLKNGLEVHFERSSTRISPQIIGVIRNEISRRSPVAMGANRAPLVQNSIGETLNLQHRVSPQVLSYVIPLLVDEGFCKANRINGGFVITKAA